MTDTDLGRDIIRAAVVLRHAVLEDLLRNAIKRRTSRPRDQIKAISVAGEIKSKLEEFNIGGAELESLAMQLEPMIKRRHRIVHYSDRIAIDARNANSHGKREWIELVQIEEWIGMVTAFVNALLSALEGRAVSISLPKRSS